MEYRGPGWRRGRQRRGGVRGLLPAAGLSEKRDNNANEPKWYCDESPASSPELIPARLALRMSRFKNKKRAGRGGGPGRAARRTLCPDFRVGSSRQHTLRVWPGRPQYLQNSEWRAAGRRGVPRPKGKGRLYAGKHLKAPGPGRLASPGMGRHRPRDNGDVKPRRTGDECKAVCLIH